MIDLYCLTSPNVQKIFIMLEEVGLPYQMKPVDVWKGEQYNSDFIKISPNSKIPVIVDHDGPGGKPYTVIESGAMRPVSFLVGAFMAASLDRFGDFSDRRRGSKGR